VATHYAALISPQILALHMQYRGANTVSLADAASVIRAQKARENGVKPKGVTPQMIGQLRNGRLKTCSVDLARAIETALDVPEGAIFVMHEKSSVKRDSDKPQTSEAA
jgi:hypothetical protein